MIAFLEGPELLIVLAIVVLVFGSSQLPKLARSLGQAQKEFKSAVSDEDAGVPEIMTAPPAGDASDNPFESIRRSLRSSSVRATRD